MHLKIQPLGSTVGAEVLGVELSSDLSSADHAALNQAFLDHSVLAIRKQDLTPEAMIEAVQVFGELFEQHNKRFELPECPKVHYISNQDRHSDGTRYIPGEGYHTDHSNDVQPPKATVLHAVHIPTSGGDTQFVDMAQAYEELDADTKAKVSDIQAVHVYQSSHSTRKLMAVSDAKSNVASREVVHPLVRVHPETGRRSLYLNPIRIERLIGLQENEAMPLLNDLLMHATQEKFQYRHKWQKGDVVIWDNRCLLHKANGDYDHAELRYLYRVMLRGDVPRGLSAAQ